MNKLKGKKLEGEQLNKLLKHNQDLKNRYYNDPIYRDRQFRDIICKNCGKSIKRRINTKPNGFCNSKCRWQYIKVNNPIQWKARCFSANLYFGIGKRGRGKLEIIEKLLQSNLGKKCKYCGDELNLSNISLDHKEPYGKTKYRKIKKSNIEKRLILDNINNLQIICLKCNRIKGNFSDEQFIKFLNFISSDEDMKQKILKRMSLGVLFYGRKRN